MQHRSHEDMSRDGAAEIEESFKGRSGWTQRIVRGGEEADRMVIKSNLDSADNCRLE